MKENMESVDLSGWLSTYGLITAERILARYKIILAKEDLLTVIKNPTCFYHRLLRLPMKNVFNGIVLQQAYDYQVYVQKLLIDYLLSEQASKEEEESLVQEDLEHEREMLLTLSEVFQEQEQAHYKLIANIQRELITLTGNWQKYLKKATGAIKELLLAENQGRSAEKIAQAINIYLIKQRSNEDEVWDAVNRVLELEVSKNIKEVFLQEIAHLNELQMNIEPSFKGFYDEASEMEQELKKYRTDFYEMILRVRQLVNVSFAYAEDALQSKENLESILFDPNLGEN